MNTSTPAAATQLNKLQTFRQAAYSCLGPARDALFELTDAALLTDQAPSFAYLALSPVFRRGWPSLYAALQDGRPDPSRLLALYAPLVQPTPTALVTPRVVLAGDVNLASLVQALPGVLTHRLQQAVARLPRGPGIGELDLVEAHE